MTTSINTSSKRSKSQRKNHDRCCILRQSNVDLMDFLAADVDTKIRLCAAILIDYHFHWYGWKIEVQRTPWVYRKLVEIWRDLMGLFSLHVIRAAHELLIRLNLLERRNNPGNAQDKTYQYKLRVGNLQRAKERMQNRSQPDQKVASARKFCSESYTFPVESHTQLPSTAIRSNSLSEVSELEDCGNEEEEVFVDLSQDVECDNDATDEVELSQEQESSSESQFSAPPAPPPAAPPQRKPKNLNSRQSKVCSAFLLDEPVFIQWWVNRLLKTKFGSEELVLTPQAFVRSNIRKNPEQALDMWDSFQSEMSHRVDNYNQRRELGCKISSEEHEQIQVIAPYATSAQQPPALPASIPQPPQPETVDAQQPAALPSSQPQPPQSENADVHQPSQEFTAPPAGFFQEVMAQLKAKVSMSKAPKVEQKSVEAELDSLNANIKDPLLRAEVLQRVMASDSYTVDFDEEGVPYQVRRV